MWRRPLLPAALWALLILVLCLLPGAALPRWAWADLMDLDKVVHATLFAILHLLLAKGLETYYSGKRPRSLIVLLAFVLSVAYGGLTELMQQAPLLGRRGDPMDLLANTAGVLLGLAGLEAFRCSQRRHSTLPETYL